jgi:adhesin/invasin
VSVTVVVEGAPIAPKTEVVTFIAASAVTPATVELQVLNAPQPANSEAAITLVVIPRDVSGTPIAGVGIELNHDSTTAQINEVSGTTNLLGEFRTTVTNNIVEIVNITPFADGVPGNSIPVNFTAIDMEWVICKSRW